MRTPAIALVFGLVVAACSGGGSSDTPSDGGPLVDGGVDPGVDAATDIGPTPDTGPRPTVPAGTIEVVSDVSTTLPKLPSLHGVKGSVAGDSVRVSFEPIAGAKDYRIYLLPKDADVTAASDGHVTVKNAIYRCAGDRMAPAASVDAVSSASGWVRTLVDGQKVGGYTRTLADATLGFVYDTPGPGRIPVYALGDPSAKADNECYFGRWNESRVKRYVTSSDERTKLISARFRDDGIAFYVPESGGVPVYVATEADDSARYYFVDGAEAKVRKGATTAFSVLAAAGTDTVPLMRVFYQNNCGNSHDELSAGTQRFERAYKQGNQPLWDLHWSGITGPTTLVIEALDEKCTYPGMIGPAHSAPYTTTFGSDVLDYQEWRTLAEAQAASPTGEVSINGQGDGTHPKAIARSFVAATPSTPTGFDWFEGFSAAAPLAPFSDTKCGAPDGNCWQQFRTVSKDYDADFINTETERHQFGVVLGELWSGFSDVAADTGGKFRFTPKVRGTMSADSFLYVTMETDTFTTGRRYPQIVISDQEAPLDYVFKTGHAIVVESFNTNTASWPNQFAVEVCDQRNWDVNDQCPAYHDLHQVLDAADKTKVASLSPAAEMGEHAGLDRSTLWEVYASTKRLYLFLDGSPYGCVDFADKGIPTGAVTVSFGHVLYHSGIDDMTNLSSFIAKHSQIEVHRHFDNLGFKSKSTAPPWDESIMPCARAAQMSEGT